jgi:hypothetical protein
LPGLALGAPGAAQLLADGRAHASGTGAGRPPRLFWFLVVPGLLVSVAIAARLHVGLVGVVLAAQGAWGWFSLRRVERLNRHLLG